MVLMGEWVFLGARAVVKTTYPSPIVLKAGGEWENHGNKKLSHTPTKKFNRRIVI